MKTLEAYLLDAEHKGVIDHQIHMTRGPGGEVRAIIFPIGMEQPAVEFEVRGDHVSAPLPAYDFAEMIEGPELATKADIEDLVAAIKRESAT